MMPQVPRIYNFVRRSGRKGSIRGSRMSADYIHWTWWRMGTWHR